MPCELDEYDFELPRELIAQEPTTNRTDSRMMVINRTTGHIDHVSVRDLPSFLRAAKPDFAVPMYEQFVAELVKISGLKVLTGIFGADMKVTLLNDGPVTIVIDSKNKE